VTAPRRSAGTTNRSLLGFAATGLLLGIALGVSGSRLSPWITLPALALLIVAMHRLGREGSDPPKP
jgi:hypothetical protein